MLACSTTNPASWERRSRLIVKGRLAWMGWNQTCFPVHRRWGFRMAGATGTISGSLSTNPKGAFFLPKLANRDDTQAAYTSCWYISLVRNVSRFVSSTALTTWSFTHQKTRIIISRFIKIERSQHIWPPANFITEMYKRTEGTYWFRQKPDFTKMKFLTVQDRKVKYTIVDIKNNVLEY